MPPSPAVRCSPGRELRAENHKRGRSLESGILFRQRDDDLALFNEVQSRERDNFLLQSNDDFEDLFCKYLIFDIFSLDVFGLCLHLNTRRTFLFCLLYFGLQLLALFMCISQRTN